MGSMQSTGALIAALVPIAYCGGLLYYFFGVGGSTRGVAAIGLGPTVLGLGAVGLLFMVPMIVRVLRLTTTRPTPGVPLEEETFDADAALARYLARKAEAGEEPQAVVPDSAPSAPVRSTFGRKTA